MESLATEASAATSASVKAHVPVPSQEEIGKVGSTHPHHRGHNFHIIRGHKITDPKITDTRR